MLMAEKMCIHRFQVVQDALDSANLTEKDLSAVAVTIGPGLSLCLRGKLEKKVSTLVLWINKFRKKTKIVVFLFESYSWCAEGSKTCW